MAINLLFLNFLSFSAWLTRKIMSGATAGFLILHSLEVYAMSYVKEHLWYKSPPTIAV